MEKTKNWKLTHNNDCGTLKHIFWDCFLFFIFFGSIPWTRDAQLCTNCTLQCYSYFKVTDGKFSFFFYFVQNPAEKQNIDNKTLDNFWVENRAVLSFKPTEKGPKPIQIDPGPLMVDF